MKAANRLGDDAAKLVQWDYLLHLPGITKCPRCHQDRIREVQSAQLDREIDMLLFSRQRDRLSDEMETEPLASSQSNRRARDPQSDHGSRWSAGTAQHDPAYQRFTRFSQSLDHATMHPLRGHMVGLVQEPEAFPEIQDGSLVLGGENQLLRSSSTVTGVGRNETTCRGANDRSEYKGNK
jgi:hypothetical protein